MKMEPNTTFGDNRQGIEEMGKTFVQVNSQPMKVRLETTVTGYRWEIFVQGRNFAEILPQIREANATMKEMYGGK
jgi:hypothetical protein